MRRRAWFCRRRVGRAGRRWIWPGRTPGWPGRGSCGRLGRVGRRSRTGPTFCGAAARTVSTRCGTGAFTQPDLFLEEEVDEVEVAHLGSLGTVDEFGDGVGDMGQAEPGGMVSDPVGGQRAHWFSFGLALARA